MVGPDLHIKHRDTLDYLVFWTEHKEAILVNGERKRGVANHLEWVQI